MEIAAIVLVIIVLIACLVLLPESKPKHSNIQGEIGYNVYQVNKPEKNTIKLIIFNK